MTRTLRGRIVELYGSLRAFAEALGWHEQKVWRIVSGTQEATAGEICAMAAALQVDIPEDMRALFFQTSPQNAD